VQVLEKSEVIDHISKTKLVTRYKYHHGYYDGREREFRGFGRVDQFDTEVFDDFAGSSLHQGQDLFENNKAGFHVPPVETRTWHHTGIYFDPTVWITVINQQYQRNTIAQTRRLRAGRAYFPTSRRTAGPGSLSTRPFAPPGSRAYAASLRSRRHGKAEHPYTVTENRYRVKETAGQHVNPHAVYLTTPRRA